MSFQILDLRGRWINAIGYCPYQLYVYDGVTYRQWCTGGNKTWTGDQLYLGSATSSTTAVQSVDIVFVRTAAGSQVAEGVVWMLMEG